MSVQFIKLRKNLAYIEIATKQQEELSYFTESKTQEEITIEYLKQWAEREYKGADFFLNWVKLIFKTSNFLSFYKFLRYPLPSSKLVNDEIKPQLQRVFEAEDSYFNYLIKNEEVANPIELNSAYQDKEFFNNILFNHNAIIVQDLDDINDPYFDLLNIKDVVSIETEKDEICKIAYFSDYENKEEGIGIKGYSYIDEQRYSFYDLKYNLIIDVPHDLGKCPAVFVSSENFSTENSIVKKSIFSYVKNDFEEFVFLKTLQKMTEPNGAIPVVTKLQTKTNKKEGRNIDAIDDKEPMSSQSIGSQRADTRNTFNQSEGELQTGTQIAVPMIRKEDGSIDMDIVKNYFNFHYIPVECLTYMNNRIKEIKSNIISSCLGDYHEQNESAKNQLQVSKSYDAKEDKLRWISRELSRIKSLTSFNVLALKHGKGSVSVHCNFGSDFFLETATDLYNDFNIAPNSFERRNILTRISQNKNRFNKEKACKEKLLYKLIPYVSDKDFEIANTTLELNDTIFELQTRFNYWIATFESIYGDISVFYENLESEENTKLILINNLLNKIINESTTKSTRRVASVSWGGT
jgi:hypothetical protein